MKHFRPRLSRRAFWVLCALRNATTLVSLLVYNYAFKSNEMGMACALAWVMFIAVALLTVIAFTSQKHWVYYAD